MVGRMEWKTRMTFAMLVHVYVTFVFLCNLTPLESIYSIGEQLVNKLRKPPLFRLVVLLLVIAV